MRLMFRPAAIDDIESTADYISDRLSNPAAAEKLKSELLSAISLLKDNPLMGMLLSERLDIDSDYRYIVIKKQIVFYELHNDYIEIVRVLDGRTDYLTRLF